MKKLMMTIFALAGLSASAAPSWIFFYVDQLAGGYSEYMFDYATVRANGDYLRIDGGDYWKLYSDDSRLTTGEVYAGTFDDSYVGDLVFELWQDGEATASYVGTYQYDDWRDHAYSNMSQTGAEALSVGADAVPEPTGGILFLLGCAALALRRRKAEVEG